VRSATHKVVFSPEAKADLLELYDYVADASNPTRALGYVERIERACRALKTFPQRGVPRNDIRPGLRVIGFERSATIAFATSENTVTILRVLYGGRDIGRAMPKLKD
jgi:toxin ParE1/3/4